MRDPAALQCVPPLWRGWTGCRGATGACHEGVGGCISADGHARATLKTMLPTAARLRALAVLRDTSQQTQLVGAATDGADVWAGGQWWLALPLRQLPHRLVSIMAWRHMGISPFAGDCDSLDIASGRTQSLRNGTHWHATHWSAVWRGTHACAKLLALTVTCRTHTLLVTMRVPRHAAATALATTTIHTCC